MSKDKNIDSILQQEEYMELMVDNLREVRRHLNGNLEYKHKIRRSDIVNAIVCDWWETYHNNPDGIWNPDAQKRILDKIINQ